MGNRKNVYGVECAIANKNSAMTGLQFALLGNCSVAIRGLQVAAIFNSAEKGKEMQIALQNEQIKSKDENEGPAILQAGVVNSGDKGTVFQIGILNLSKEKTVQVGLINYSKKNILPICPLFNF